MIVIFEVDSLHLKYDQAGSAISFKVHSTNFSMKNFQATLLLKANCIVVFKRTASLLKAKNNLDCIEKSWFTEITNATENTRSVIM